MGDLLSRIGLLGGQRFVDSLRGAHGDESGPGFRLRAAGRRCTAVLLDEAAGLYRVGDTGVEARVKIDVNEEYGAAVQRITLTNTGDEASPPFSLLDGFHIPLDVTVGQAPTVCAVGGGPTNGFYPPRAYREERVCFGLARKWEPPNPSHFRHGLAQRRYRITSADNGRSTGLNLPIMQVQWETPDGGIGLWAALEWSGYWQITFEAERDWRFLLHGGPLVRGLILEPGESIALPPVHMGIFVRETSRLTGESDALAAGANSVRRYLAGVHAPNVEGRRPGPFVAYHHWFGIEGAITEELLLRQADRAAELGVEYFEVDAGWFADSTELFGRGVGNWDTVDRDKLPNGLEAVSEYVRARGMRFGLWFEPERAHVGTDWISKHPEWYGDPDEYDNCHLDLSRRDAQDGVIELLSSRIELLDIRWLRWDNNMTHGPFWESRDPTGKIQFRYLAGLYRVMDTLLERHPDLLIDNCASGGHRSDPGTLKRAATMVMNDHSEDPHVCRIMQTGGARFLPANYMNSSIYVGEHDGDDFVGPLELISRMAGSVSLSGHIAAWSEKQRDRVRRYLDGFKGYRHLLMRDFHRLTPYPRTDGDWDAVQFVDPACGDAVILAYRFRGRADRLTVFPVHLKAGAAYSLENPFTGGESEAEISAAKRTGASLMEEGLELILPPDGAVVRRLLPE